MNFTINKNIAHEIIDGEAVIVNFDNGNYYSLNKNGAEIWSYIERDTSLMTIIEECIRRYQGGGTEIEKSVHQFLANLEKENIISIYRESKGENADPIKATEGEPNAEKPKFEAPVLNTYTDMQELLLLDPIHEVDENGWPNIKKEIFPEEKKDGD